MSGQAGYAQLRQPAQRRVVAEFPGGEDEHHGVGEQPAGDEGERLRGLPVEPLGVVDEADQRALVGGVGQQAENGQSDEEAVGRGPLPQPEHRAERVPLRWREPLEPTQERRAQLVEPGERQLELRLDADRSHDAAPHGSSGQVIQERGLADAGVAADHQDLAAARSDPGEQAFQPVALALAAVQAGSTGLAAVHPTAVTGLDGSLTGRSRRAGTMIGRERSCGGWATGHGLLGIGCRAADMVGIDLVRDQ